MHATLWRPLTRPRAEALATLIAVDRDPRAGDTCQSRSPAHARYAMEVADPTRSRQSADSGSHPIGAEHQAITRAAVSAAPANEVNSRTARRSQDRPAHTHRAWPPTRSFRLQRHATTIARHESARSSRATRGRAIAGSWAAHAVACPSDISRVRCDKIVRADPALHRERPGDVVIASCHSVKRSHGARLHRT
jgi:hypothetical protein